MVFEKGKACGGGGGVTITFLGFKFWVGSYFLSKKRLIVAGFGSSILILHFCPL